MGGARNEGGTISPSGAFQAGDSAGGFTGGSGHLSVIDFSASRSNSIYTDNGKVLPLSISKQSYIIYK